MSDTWGMIGSERASFVEGIGSVAPGSFDRPSLCAGWSVRDVVAHITATALMTPPKFIGKLASSGFGFNKMLEKDIKSLEASNSDEELVALLATKVSSRSGPPGPPMAMLGEIVLHGEDVFRALGAYGEHPVDHLVAVADFYKTNSVLVPSKKRIAGLGLRATDAEWSAGTGPEVTGPLVALVMAMGGRKVALDDLSGEGVAVMSQRM